MFVSSEDTRQNSMFLTPKEFKNEFNDTRIITINVTSFVVPPLFIQTSTLLFGEMKQNVLNQASDEIKPLITVEFTGIPIKGSESNGTGTSLASQNDCDVGTCSSQEYVVLYPAIAST